MHRGILIFAKNNEKIDYVRQAEFCAYLAKLHLNYPTCLITDQEINSQHFDLVITADMFKSQKRRYNIGELSYFNLGRTSAYSLSPFDETLIIDSDYFIQNNNLNSVWGSAHNMHMNKEYRSIYDPKYESPEPFIGKWSAFMFWATVVYFRKSKKSKIFFDLAKHVEENYDYYRASYNLPGRMIRNDYVFSVAAHLLGGNIPPLPVPEILNSFDSDEIIAVDKNSITFLCERKHIGQTFVVKVPSLNVHIMDKSDLSKKLNLFKEAYNV